MSFDPWHVTRSLELGGITKGFNACLTHVLESVVSRRLLQPFRLLCLVIFLLLIQAAVYCLGTSILPT